MHNNNNNNNNNNVYILKFQILRVYLYCENTIFFKFDFLCLCLFIVKYFIGKLVNENRFTEFIC